MRTPEMFLKIGRLKRRADFLLAAKGKRFHVGSMSVQGASNMQGGPDKDPAATAAGQGLATTAAGRGTRIGFTLTRKVGNAVIRNRARRRLKEAVRLSPDLPVVADHDYVIIGRIEAVRLPFTALKRELARAIRGVHESGRSGRQRSNETRPKRTRPET